MITTDFHIHTNFCDGKSSAEEIVITAIEKGFTKIGFSSHSYNEPDKDFALNEITTPKYQDEISRLKDKYKNDIEILCGIEQDYFSTEDTSFYDYVIGSAHYILKDNFYIAVDDSKERIENALNTYYNGDFDNLAQDYFEVVSDIVNKINPQIIGHFDLLLKYSESLGYKITPRFLNLAENAVKKLVKFNIPFEINTGAVARGVRSVPYPDKSILKIINKYGGKIIFTSDCHHKDNLGFYFKEAETLAKECGFKKHTIITKDGFKELQL